ncbi:shTK domain protein [Ancylostoma caninum]|uniref:ShTK domain protein n=1 Tax=Ancylostoma caninum TaxID=29170 RepID=A0A368EWY4_ANCCA|nr:shTK domain protein [Ancylostoma caninum]
MLHFEPLLTSGELRQICKCKLCGTGRERNCCDKHPSCASWARRGECSKNPKWMLPNCQLSCHNCETDSEERSMDEAREFR